MSEGNGQPQVHIIGMGMEGPPKKRLEVLSGNKSSLEEELDSYPCLLRCIFDQAGVGVAEVNLHNHRIVRVNEAFGRLIGRSSQDLRQRSFLDLGAQLDGPDSVFQHEVQFFEELLSGRKISVTWYASYLLPPEGGYSTPSRSFKLTATPLPEAPSGERSCIVVLDDISEQKQAVLALRDIHQQLEQRVAERTAELFAANESMRFQIAERKRIEEALRQSVALYRTIAASIPDAAVLVIGKDLRFRVVEGLLLGALGISRTMLEGTFIGRTEHGPFGQLLLEIFVRTLEGVTSSNEKSLHDKTLYLLSTPLRNNDCIIVGAVVLIIDISDRKRAEQERLRMERRYLQIVQTANEGIWLIDQDARITFANDQMAELLRTKRENMIGADVYQFVFPEDLPSFRTQLYAQNHGIDGRYESRLRRMDGTECWIQCSAKAMHDETGAFIGSFGMFTDVTQRRKTESLLRASEQRFRAIIEASTEGILVFSNSTSMIRYANPRACEMLRYSTDELICFSFLDLFPERTNQALRSRTASPSTEPTPNTGELRRKDGGTIQVGIKSVTLDLEGEQCLVLFITDLTARSLLEQERLKAQKLDAIGTLAGGIAHDFNNLLQAIFANISMARQCYDSKEESLRRLESVEHSLHLAIKLTGQLLAFSKGASLQKRRIPLGPLIEEATSFILSGAKASCSIDIDPLLWHTEVDEGQLHQVIYNIVLNADQSMPTGGNIEVRARNVVAPAEGLPAMLLAGRWVSVTVKDTGIGIAEEHMGRIFDPYFSTKATGNGLGLATTYAVVRKHGGFIDVRSKLGLGTEVTVYLPACDRDGETPRRGTVAAPGRSLHVLLLDDDESVRQTSQALLQFLGHSVIAVSDGEAALEAYQQFATSDNPFNLLLLDLTIKGGMGGMETLNKLRISHPNLRAILTSGYSDESLSKSDLPSQARVFLPKPYTLEQLRAAIENAIADSAELMANGA
ncbi:MAG: PAS domain S-box protein [Myxococcales bacterium]|nr:PAS domain S-box protein [Myxococcales bacterium]